MSAMLEVLGCKTTPHSLKKMKPRGS